jgi:hypothetical protein
MAFYAGNILVLSVEFKGSCVMVKVIDFPYIKVMTFQAICKPVILKLFKMNILVAGGAGYG